MLASPKQRAGIGFIILSICFNLRHVASVCIWKDPWIALDPNSPITNAKVDSNSTGSLTASFDENNQIGALFILYYSGSSDADKPKLGTSSAFSMACDTSSTSCSLKASRSLDFELSASEALVINCDVAYKTITVKLRDLNDNTPFFTTSPGRLSFFENEVGRLDGNFCASDNDLIDLPKLSFKITVDDSPSDNFQVASLAADKKCGQVEVIRALDFEEQTSYLLQVTVTDGNYSSQLFLPLSVIDKPDMPPQWSKFSPVIFITEDNEQNVEIRQFQARDGDLGVNRRMIYSLEKGKPDQDIDINSNTGSLYLTAKVDRDIAGPEVFTWDFTVTATEDIDGESVSAAVVLTVSDVNDNTPSFTRQGTIYKASIAENFVGELVFDSGIEVTDKDFGPNGSYKAAIIFDDPTIPTDKLSIVSASTGTSSGSQITQYKIMNSDATFFDYEIEQRRKISFKVEVTEVADPTHKSSEMFEIIVGDVNDNVPEFVNQPPGGYIVSVLESSSVGSGLDLAFEVNDKDVSEEFGKSSLKFELVAGVLEGKLAIDAKTGMITLIQTVDREQLLAPVQLVVRLADMQGSASGLAISTSVVVTIEDVNDERPRLTLPAVIEEIVEGYGTNPPGDNMVIATGITADDPDKSPRLVIAIDWKNTKFYSSSAWIQNGAGLKYEDYFTLSTIEESPNRVTGSLAIGKYRPDMELFDTVEIAIVVVDENTDLNFPASKSSSGKLSLRISGINDNAPEFLSPSTQMSLTEELSAEQTVARFRLQDKDALQTVTLSLKSCDKEGLLKVEGFDLLSTVPIDYEFVQKIECVLLATDNGDPPLSVELAVVVNIIDINDNAPEWDVTSTVVEIPENTPTSDVVIKKVSAKDLDSGAYGTVSYLLPEAFNIDGGLDRFQIGLKTGEITVKLQGNAILDFEKKSTYSLSVEARDNYRPGVSSGSLANTIVLTINLTDVNDNSPVFESQVNTCYRTPLESVLAGAEVGPVLASDADFLEENKKITYSFVSFTARPPTAQPSVQLFDVRGDSISGGKLVAANNLTGFYGEYIVTIQGKDSGSPSLSGTGSFLICVEDINDNKPVITFPKSGAVLNVKETNIVGGNVLYEVGDGTTRPLIATGTDKDSGQNAAILYDITAGSAEATSTFVVNSQSGVFTLAKQLDPTVIRKFNLTLRARDQGIPQLSSDPLTVFTIVVLGVGDQPPGFPIKTVSANFLENKAELAYEFEAATDIDNSGLEPSDPLYQKLCYFVVGGAGNFFEIRNHEVPQIHNKMTLDREDPDQKALYILIMVKSNDCTVQPPNQADSPDRKDILRIDVIIDDENDEPPVFGSSVTAGLTPDYKNRDIVTTIVAVDPDLNDVLTYKIISAVQASDASIQGYDETFELEGKTGVLKVLFTPTLEMKGYFSFNVSATDILGHRTDTTAKIYMVGSEHEYLIVFSNDLKEVEPKRIEIQNIFSEVLGKRCNIQKVVPGESVNIGNSSEVTSHFVDEDKNEPISKTEIQQQLSIGNTTLEIQRRLLEQTNLLLIDLRPKSVKIVDQIEEIFMILFILASAILGLLVIVISTCHCIRVSRLKRQVKALATTQFGSMDSGLNRAGMGLPNTNRFAEGANPVWNVDEKKMQPDNASLSSGDSVLIGIEDNPEFKNYKTGMSNPAFSSEKSQPKNPLFGLSQGEANFQSFESDDDNEDEL